MLLPSALQCDPSYHAPPLTRFQSNYASPPMSPPTTSHSTINNLYSTCRALQSMLSTSNQQLATPPMTVLSAPTPSSFKLRLRTRKTPSATEPESTAVIPRKRITKRSAPRGMNKRRRAVDDDAMRGTGDSDDDEGEQEEDGGPSTPKRMRLAPEIIPMGLERSDFQSLHLQPFSSSTFSFSPAGIEPRLESSAQENEREKGENESEEWTSEEDRLLVELVLEKLKLSKSDWQDCARSLGKDRGSVGRRWRSLMVGGDVGIKNRSRRVKIHGTWR